MTHCPVCQQTVPSFTCSTLSAHACAVHLKNTQDALKDDLLFFDNLGFIVRVENKWRRLVDDEFYPQHNMSDDPKPLIIANLQFVRRILMGLMPTASVKEAIEAIDEALAILSQ